jgi:hypothetical protein
MHHPITAKPVNEAHAREMLNRTRVWLNCFNLDRSTGSEYGKPPIIKNSDYVANHSETWFESSPYNLKHFDIHLCAYNAELKVMAKFGEKIYSDPDHPTGLNKVSANHALATDMLIRPSRKSILRRSQVRRTINSRLSGRSGFHASRRRIRPTRRTDSGRACCGWRTVTLGWFHCHLASSMRLAKMDQGRTLSCNA